MNENPDATPNADEPETAAAEAVRERIVKVLKTVYDPEIPVDIYEMGLIYRIAVKQANDQNTYPVDVVMTLTTPMCPVAETLPPEVEAKIRSVEGVAEVQLDLVWDPPWTPDMMSEAAKLALNM
ncbi:MAG: DUF59 domain-containing protein [Deltaproteobacteria bacterium]|nr:DUF59 domain-containing protein [Deltaproteobacteria bacterium]MBW2391367.1 DUF59 domain-containing protein [Deltaproteobacteria bacterium]MBW2725648.1 DUF59 domain-containing protein [Deltaproteobacteria bacterium]